ncbi:wall-associated receptor kinase 2-like [Hibiscus syriacus]|uniref:beta-glucosidase n=1 Tax=Hibiscus syriacus TaxID=106335 RepID=A0A6A2ZND6_HIBSY|nr:wall-associated receptor kinase 2-like [Hibiscus syriacus]
MIYGIDAVHGHNNVATGIPYVFAPCIAVCRDPRWGRCYESYSEDHKIVQLMTEIIPGLQGDPPANSKKGVPFGLDRITSPPHANYSYSVEAGVGAGIDMIMVPYNFTEFIDDLTYQVKHNIIPMSRIDDAVKRILRVKFVMGLFENPMADNTLVNQLRSQAHRELAREAPLLPLPKKATKILVAGTHADNLGYQCGGWTIAWQGLSGNDLTTGTTILQAVKNMVDPSTQVVYSQNPDAEFVKSGKLSHAIVVVGEPSYAETNGDSLNLTISQPGPDTIYNVCGAVKCVVVLISGRPVVMQPYLSSIDALVAAWLPGTEGQGVADVLFGDYGFTGKLARTWFKTVDHSL